MSCQCGISILVHYTSYIMSALITALEKYFLHANLCTYIYWCNFKAVHLTASEAFVNIQMAIPDGFYFKVQICVL